MRATLGFLRYLRKDPIALFFCALFFVIVLVGVFGDLLMPFDPFKNNLRAGFRAPDAEYLLGGDQFGRDVLSRVILATRVTLLITGTALAFTILVGVPTGMIVGYFGGWLEAVVMRLTDIILIFPTIMIAIVLVTITGPTVEGVVISLGLAQIPHFIRIARGVTLSVREELYVEAARAVGVRDGYILLRHVWPNIASVVVVQATLTLPVFVLVASSLSYLGLGVQPPTPEWGQMLNEARPYLRNAPHLLIGPGAALFLFVLSSNILGDSLQEYLNPRLRKKR